MELALDYRIYKSYRVDSKIGKGVYGQVYKVFDKATHKPFAIKKIIDAFQNLTDAKRTYRQLTYLLQISHPCIVKLEKVIIGEQDQATHKNGTKNVYAVFELMEIDLAKTLQITKLQLLQRKYIAMQILFGLEYLHASELIHRDIKPSNILLNQSCEAKICDFGLVRKASQFHEASKINEQVFTEYVASKWYRSPQIMLSGNQVSTYAIDMWSAGCVLAEMCLGVPLFNGNNTIEQLERIFMIIGMPLQSQIQSISSDDGKFLLKNFRKIKRTPLTQILANQASPEQIDLISKLLLFDPYKRMTAKQAINHPYFDALEDLKLNFKYFPTKITDNSLRKSDPSLQTYRQLIESLCVTTKRASTTRSKQSLQSNLSNKQMPRYQSSKLQENIKQKSTRQSNSGLLKKYKIPRKKEEQEGDELEGSKNIMGARIANKAESKVSLKARSKSKQSTKSITNKKVNTSYSNKSKTKLTQYKSCNKIKPFKPQISINQKPDHSIKIPKKKKKV